MKRIMAALLLTVSVVSTAALPAYAGEVMTFEAVRSGSSSSSDLPSKELESLWREEEKNEAPSEDRVWQVSVPAEADLEEFALEVLERTNQERELRGLSRLEADQTLTQMAVTRARELETAYSHTRPSGENCRTIFEEYETNLRFYGENAAKGQESPEAVVKAWMDSEGHRENLLREGAQYLGVGVWQDEDGVLYWEQLFAQAE